MTDWIVSKLLDGGVEVTSSNREIPKQDFTFTDGFKNEPFEPASLRAFKFIEKAFEWGDRILTEEAK
jgi:hypothetical protein